MEEWINVVNFSQFLLPLLTGIGLSYLMQLLKSQVAMSTKSKNFVVIVAAVLISIVELIAFEKVTPDTILDFPILVSLVYTSATTWYYKIIK